MHKKQRCAVGAFGTAPGGSIGVTQLSFENFCVCIDI
jgi:hypothetical protein